MYRRCLREAIRSGRRVDDILLDEVFEIDTFALELFHADIPLLRTETHVSLYLSES